MNIHDALKSGKPFRNIPYWKRIWDKLEFDDNHWLIIVNGEYGKRCRWINEDKDYEYYGFCYEEILSDTWEIKE